MPLRLLAVVALLAALLAAHGQVLQGQFLWDDLELAVDNPALHGPDGPARIWRGDAGVEYVPLTQSLWRVERRHFGREPAGWHAVNLALHAVAGLLLWAVLRRLSLPSASVAAAAWALHPLTVASTGWISETKNTLCQVFAGLTAWAWLRWRERAASGGRTGLLAGATLLAFAACLAAKPTLVFLPLVLLLLGWWRQGGCPTRELRAATPLVALALAASAMTIHVQHGRAMGAGVLEATPPVERLLLAARGAWFYLEKSWWPLDLSALYPHWSADASAARDWLPLLALLVICGAALVARRGWGRPVLAGSGAFVLLLAPALGLVPKSFDAIATVSDHFAYAALVVPVAGAVALGARLLQSALRGVAPAAAVALLAALGLLSHARAGLYRDPVTLFEDVLRRHPDTWMAHQIAGAARARAGDLPGAESHLRRAAELHGSFPDAHAALGAVLLDAGRPQEAEAESRRALELEPGQPEAHATLARLLLQRGDAPGALRELAAALAAAPDDADLLNLLGVARASLGDPAAEEAFRDALAARPDFPEALNNLALLLAARGTSAARDEARRLLLKALRLRPDYDKARDSLQALED